MIDVISPALYASEVVPHMYNIHAILVRIGLRS